MIPIALLLSLFSLAYNDGSGNNMYNRKPVNTFADSTILLPLGGNTWAQNAPAESRLITSSGIENWTDPGVTFNTYFRIQIPGSLKIKIKAKTVRQSLLQIEINGLKKELTINGNGYQWYETMEWHLKDTGYIKIHLSGLSKTGKRFADVSEYELTGSAIDGQTAFVKNNEGNYFYWGRRGPSVHLNFSFADSIKATWFYNEITVPERNDIIGSYFMAIGFSEGYYGIQVNSPWERRILFSVWSPFKTDDPESIPESQRITMLKKGDSVYTGEFGDEGSGGQSFLRYNWKAGLTYKFLLGGSPDNSGNTIYTAYFLSPEMKNWKLIASFKRPQTNTHLKKFHCFLENFIPEQGDKERSVFFSNQWVGDVSGNWIELNKANFTYDNTAAKGYRKDYAGGVKGKSFYLKNCGFFNQYTLYKKEFERAAINKRPHIDFTKLP